jgi:hypothetical protein
MESEDSLPRSQEPDTGLQMNPSEALLFYLFSIHFILVPYLRLGLLAIHFFQVFIQKLCTQFHPLLYVQRALPFHPPGIDLRHNIWRVLQITKHHIIQFPLASCCFIPRYYVLLSYTLRLRVCSLPT